MHLPSGPSARGETDGYRGPSRSIKIERGDPSGSERVRRGVRAGPNRSIKIGRGEIGPGRMSGCGWR
jgi:hypothetical protein